MTARHPLAILAANFVTGAAAGLLVVAGVSVLSPGGAALLDLHGDGLDVWDLAGFAWLFGHVAILVHHVLPGVVRS